VTEVAFAIAIDLQAAQSAAHGERGIARYSIELTTALVRRRAPISAVMLNPDLPNPRRLPAELLPHLTFATAREAGRQQRASPFAYQIMSPIELEAPATRALSRAALARADAVVVVLYDLIPLLFADRYFPNELARAQYVARLSFVADADLVLAISESTRRDAIEHLGIAPERIVAIGGGATSTFRPPEPHEDPSALVRAGVPAIGREFVLGVSGYDWRKNTEALIEAFARMPQAVRAGRQLVIACAVPPEGERAWRAHATSCGLASHDVVITGYVDEPLLRALYQAASLFVFPSLYEGYGLPALEAARCGTPVLTSDSSSLPEILELPASTFPADDVDAMADRMAAALTDPGFRDELVRAGRRAGERHTWDAVAGRVERAYADLERRVRGRPRSRIRARVAVVGPLPPTESGIAVYNERVLTALDRGDLEIDLFVEAPRGAPPADPPIDVPTYPIEALGPQLDPRDYDTVLCTIGNSGFHVRTFDLARRVPGVLWLHDAYLIGLHVEWALWQIRSCGRPTDVLTILREEIDSMYGGRIPPAHVLVEPLSHHAFVERQVYLTSDLVRRSRHLVLNSDLAHDMVRFDAGPDGHLPPATVLRHAIPDRSVLPIPAQRSPRPRPLVVALGIVHAIKRPEVLLRAVASLHDEVDVAFVGPCDPDLARVLRAEADRLGIGARVELTGFVDMADYARWIGDAALAVQLRDVSFGESSGAIHDAIAGALPVITSIASAADLPPDVVAMVAPDCSVADLRSTMETLLGDAQRIARATTAARAYAAEWSFARVADEIGRVLRSDALMSG
jgi:glycosyltransferase involved in cell wall biosynthesis